MRGYGFLVALMILAPLAVGTSTTILAIVFGYPGIGDQAGGEVLAAFVENQATIMVAFYVLTLAEFGRAVISVGLHQVLSTGRDAWYLGAVTLFGVLAGTLRMLDYVLWPFLVPRLAEAYSAPSATEATRESSPVLMRALFSYLGDGLGGNLGILFIILWISGLSALMLRSELFPGWVSTFGFVVSALYTINYIEFLGSTTGLIGTLGTVAQVLISLWVVAAGVVLLLRSRQMIRTGQAKS
jgi:hypothetical protein